MPDDATKMSLMPRLSATKHAVSPSPHRPVRRAIIPSPPPWVFRFVGQDATSGAAGFVMSEGGVEVACLADSGNTSLITARVRGARGFDADEFEAITARAYRAVRASLGRAAMHPVRFWNYLPEIHEPMDERRDRYMVFNAGRFAALSDWFGGAEMLPARLPAASGVGLDGDDLEIHCLALDRPGEAVENPRQIPAFRYSQRYGPLPPCFARATVVNDPTSGEPLLLVAGTASIRGEQSVHQGDLAAQLDETAMNLRALIGAANEARRDDGPANFADPLAAFSDVCVYYVRRQDAKAIESYIDQNFGTAANLQMIQADICRADLLVEIEGIARLSAK
jgi:chorismate lyase/3-hydroxybenzoate synthase